MIRIISLILLVSCSVKRSEYYFSKGERLWFLGSYEKAISYFSQVEANHELYSQAQLSAALLESYFLNQHEEALKRLSLVLTLSTNHQTTWKVNLFKGDLLFNKLKRYEEAFEHYQKMIKEYPTSSRIDEFMFLSAKSLYLLWKFNDSAKMFQDITQLKSSPLMEKSWYEMGVSYMTLGESFAPNHPLGIDAFKKAIKVFQQYLDLFDEGLLTAQVQYALANCFENLDQLPKALELLSKLETSHPSPSVVRIKKKRIHMRMSKKSG